jgi:hypothetical protein
MTKPEFHVLLIAASFEATRFGQKFAHQTLPFVFRYRAHLNYSFDKHALLDDKLYPEEDGKVIDLSTEDEASTLLWRDGRCPEWIDVAVHAVTREYTLLRLLCCGRFTAAQERLYYHKRGFGPFGIKSPDLPPGWTEGTRFEIKPPNQSLQPTGQLARG